MSIFAEISIMTTFSKYFANDGTNLEEIQAIYQKIIAP